MFKANNKSNIVLIVILAGIAIIIAITVYRLKVMPKMNNNSKKTDFPYNPAFMERAIDLSAQASLVKKTGGVFGAVVVKDGEIVGEGYNQVISQNDPTWHAEIQALREAGKKLGTPHLTGCVLYTSAECCPMCLTACYWAHIDHIYYGASVADALKYGEFKDVDFYAQVCKKPADRLIGMTQKMHTEAVDIWKKFSVMPDRARY